MEIGKIYRSKKFSDFVVMVINTTILYTTGDFDAIIISVGIESFKQYYNFVGELVSVRPDYFEEYIGDFTLNNVSL